MRSTLVTLIALLLGCSKPTTKSGDLGTVDLHARLPPGVTAPPDAELEAHDAKFAVCGLGGDAAEVRVTWKSFKKGDDGYVVSCAAEVTKPTKGVVVTLESTAKVGRAPKDSHLGVAMIELKCTRHESSSLVVDSTESIYVLSSGESSMKK
jgi:hypothetical protein